MASLTGLAGGEQAAQVGAVQAEPNDAAADLARIDGSLAEVLERLERLEAGTGD